MTGFKTRTPLVPLPRTAFRSCLWAEDEPENENGDTGGRLTGCRGRRMRRWSVRLGSFIAVSSVTRALPYPSSISVSSLRTAACSPMMMSTSPPMSKRILSTDEPCIVQMQKMMAGKEGVLSLAQGIVHWKPPKSAAEAARNALEEDDTNRSPPPPSLLSFALTPPYRC